MHDRSGDPACAAACQRLLQRVREGWDPDRVAKALAQSNPRRLAIWEKAKAYATSTMDSWDVPPGANVFPMK